MGDKVQALPSELHSNQTEEHGVNGLFVAYFVTNDGGSLIATFTRQEMDLTWQPSECFWLVPGTQRPELSGDAPEPQEKDDE